MPSQSSQQSSPQRDGWGNRISHEVESWPLRLVDAGFLGLIVLLPFFWGGRQALGNFAVVLMSGWTCFWWAIHQLRQDRPRWRFSGAEPLFLLAIVLVILQTVSLPETIKDTLSPHIDKLLPYWGTDPETSLGLGYWSTLSFAPWQTWSDLVTLISVMLVFFIATQRLEAARDVHRMMRYVAISGCVTALFGLSQYLVGNGMFYWFFDHPDTNPRAAAKAAFTNANHFANYLAMCLPFQLWWYVTVSRSIQRLRHARDINHPAPTGWRAFVMEWTPAMMLGLTSVAIVLSQSRGGLLVAGVGVTVTCLLFWRQRLVDSRIALWLVSVSVAGVLALMLFGDRLERKLTKDIDAITSGKSQQIDRESARKKIWMTDLKVCRDFPVVGTGLGTHRYVYKSYHDFPIDGTEYSHAENGYLQVAMETGITGLAITLLLIGLVGYWCLIGLWQANNSDAKAPLSVAVAVLLVNLLHSCTDFIWYVPSCMVTVVLTAAFTSALSRRPAASRSSQLESSWGPTSRWGWVAMLFVAVGGMTWGAQVKWPELAAEPHYLEFKRLARINGHEKPSPESIRAEIAAILRAAKANPHDPVIQSRAARAHVRLFVLQHDEQHDLKLEDIRQAALASQYEDRQALNDWLDIPEVMGEGRKDLHRAQVAYLRAMRLCPLEPRPYIETAKLGWLNLTSPELEERLLQQALTVHPYEGQAWLEYAHALHEVGRTEEAIPSYQKAFEKDARCRNSVIADLAPVYPVGFLLDSFEMDRPSLITLRQIYKGANDERGYRNILERLAQAELAAALETTGDSSAGHIVEAHDCYVEMDEVHLATRTLQDAVKRHANSFRLRSKLANWLFDCGQYSAALPHLEWCHNRRPDIKSIVHRIELAETRPDEPMRLVEDPEDAKLVQ
ncbi:MAG: O-antigen ligase family protein [Planctomycetaceae bacterium]